MGAETVIVDIGVAGQPRLPSQVRRAAVASGTRTSRAARR